jgi:hypothetical protein
MSHQTKQAQPSKKDWARPEVKKLEAGAAESSHGGAPDGGGGNQQS